MGVGPVKEWVGSARLAGIPAFDHVCIDDGLPRRLASSLWLLHSPSACLYFEHWVLWVSLNLEGQIFYCMSYLPLGEWYGCPV